DRAAGRGGVEPVAADRGADVVGLGQDAVGGVEALPAELGQVGLDPGVGSLALVLVRSARPGGGTCGWCGGRRRRSTSRSLSPARDLVAPLSHTAAVAALAACDFTEARPLRRMRRGRRSPRGRNGRGRWPARSGVAGTLSVQAGRKRSLTERGCATFEIIE